MEKKRGFKCKFCRKRFKDEFFLDKHKRKRHYVELGFEEPESLAETGPPPPSGVIAPQLTQENAATSEGNELQTDNHSFAANQDQLLEEKQGEEQQPQQQQSGPVNELKSKPPEKVSEEHPSEPALEQAEEKEQQAAKGLKEAQEQASLAGEHSTNNLSIYISEKNRSNSNIDRSGGDVQLDDREEDRRHEDRLDEPLTEFLYVRNASSIHEDGEKKTKSLAVDGDDEKVDESPGIKQPSASDVHSSENNREITPEENQNVLAGKENALDRSEGCELSGNVTSPVVCDEDVDKRERDVEECSTLVISDAAAFFSMSNDEDAVDATDIAAKTKMVMEALMDKIESGQEEFLRENLTVGVAAFLDKREHAETMQMAENATGRNGGANVQSLDYNFSDSLPEKEAMVARVHAGNESREPKRNESIRKIPIADEKVVNEKIKKPSRPSSPEKVAGDRTTDAKSTELFSVPAPSQVSDLCELRKVAGGATVSHAYDANVSAVTACVAAGVGVRQGRVPIPHLKKDCPFRRRAEVRVSPHRERQGFGQSGNGQEEPAPRQTEKRAPRQSNERATRSSTEKMPRRPASAEPAYGRRSRGDGADERPASPNVESRRRRKLEEEREESVERFEGRNRVKRESLRRFDVDNNRSGDHFGEEEKRSRSPPKQIIKSALKPETHIAARKGEAGNNGIARGNDGIEKVSDNWETRVQKRLPNRNYSNVAKTPSTETGSAMSRQLNQDVYADGRGKREARSALKTRKVSGERKPLKIYTNYSKNPKKFSRESSPQAPDMVSLHALNESQAPHATKSQPASQTPHVSNLQRATHALGASQEPHELRALHATNSQPVSHALRAPKALRASQVSHEAKAPHATISQPASQAPLAPQALSALQTPHTTQSLQASHASYASHASRDPPQTKCDFDPKKQWGRPTGKKGAPFIHLTDESKFVIRKFSHSKKECPHRILEKPGDTRDVVDSKGGVNVSAGPRGGRDPRAHRRGRSEDARRSREARIHDRHSGLSPPIEEEEEEEEEQERERRQQKQLQQNRKIKQTYRNKREESSNAETGEPGHGKAASKITKDDESSNRSFVDPRSIITTSPPKQIVRKAAPDEDVELFRPTPPFTMAEAALTAAGPDTRRKKIGLRRGGGSGGSGSANVNANGSPIPVPHLRKDCPHRDRPESDKRRREMSDCNYCNEDAAEDESDYDARRRRCPREEDDALGAGSEWQRRRCYPVADGADRRRPGVVNRNNNREFDGDGDVFVGDFEGDTQNKSKFLHEDYHDEDFDRWGNEVHEIGEDEEGSGGSSHSGASKCGAPWMPTPIEEMDIEVTCGPGVGSRRNVYSYVDAAYCKKEWLSDWYYKGSVVKTSPYMPPPPVHRLPSKTIVQEENRHAALKDPDNSPFYFIKKKMKESKEKGDEEKDDDEEKRATRGRGLKRGDDANVNDANVNDADDSNVNRKPYSSSDEDREGSAPIDWTTTRQAERRARPKRETRDASRDSRRRRGGSRRREKSADSDGAVGDENDVKKWRRLVRKLSGRLGHSGAAGRDEDLDGRDAGGRRRDLEADAGRWSELKRKVSDKFGVAGGGGEGGEIGGRRRERRRRQSYDDEDDRSVHRYDVDGRRGNLNDNRARSWTPERKRGNKKGKRGQRKEESKNWSLSNKRETDSENRSEPEEGGNMAFEEKRLMRREANKKKKEEEEKRKKKEKREREREEREKKEQEPSGPFVMPFIAHTEDWVPM